MIGRSGVLSMATNSRTAIRNDRPTVPAPIVAITFFGSRLPKMPVIAAPTNGTTGISQRMLYASTPSPLQQVAAVHIQRFAVAEHRNYQSQAHCGFRSSDHQHKENENLTTDLAVLSGERDKRHVHGVEHDFHG